ncbi:Na/Pi cotransporter family protein [Oharaeibacter diazotrophicus]|uniref:Phosphate:Na+ symporter n=1 Tax=Oharaeibacter diazotrophicus TaxID=1920512 RepID=A0A4R6RGB3_9HYPH|nr:Na/Pi cotransporter family protein [Oharaeibacter diazotrophicus]TDP85330.1 phosphate:Na+ symporter [Oharaeibacter diazotrophicus]BBE74300.1 Na+/Pi-cotransporter [Pleomorphomonas sp. SM30]GLS76009.1 Na/Pi cotransporter [Oharaeibacter diazotrophicus]
MADHQFLLDLLGGIALLVFATRMVKTGILRAYENALRTLLRRATATRIGALAAGVAAAAALQSSTAAGLLTASFAERGLVTLSAGLAVMLGADVGSTLVVQVMSVNLAALAPVLLVVGVLAFLDGRRPRVRQIGRVIVGLALMILSLKMIVAASGPARGSAAFDAVIAGVGGDVLLTVVFAAAATWMVHSSVAMVLLFMSLAASGAVPVPVALALTLGANVGSGMIPLGLTAGSGPSVRRILWGNFGFRVAGAAAAAALLPWIGPVLGSTGLSPAAQVALAHTGFNLLLAAVFLPVTGPVADLLVRLVPEPVVAPSPSRPLHLDDDLLDRPGLALGAATRELMRLADMVEAMLREAIVAFEPDGAVSRASIASQDTAIDELQEEIKLYLTRLTRGPLGEAEARRAFDLVVFTTNLEHVGDVIDKSLLPLAEKMRRRHVAFSDSGWREIREMHRTVLEQMRLALTVFVTQDTAMARDLIARKDEIRSREREAIALHLERLRAGTPASIETSAVHLDVIRDLKRIAAHVAVVAHPILEQAGLIGGSRLKSA